MSLMLTTLSFLFSFISNFGDTYAAPTKQLCRPEQRDILLEFKNEFETDVPCIISLDPFSSKTNILYPQTKTQSWRYNKDCCDWDGITCDPKSGEVIKLDLSYSCLHGRFHSNTSLLKLKNLPSLNNLSLSYNSLSGEVLSTIGNLSHLTSLSLSNNQFSGGIPLSIENLAHLTSLDLSNNQFSGGVPFSIGNLSHLNSLDLSNNQFSGGVPFSIGNLSHLTSLDLSSNQFTGEISPVTENLLHLTILRLSNNKFDGNIAFSIGNLSHLTSLDLSNNHFSGGIAFSIGNLSHLTFLDLSDNDFSGEISSLTENLPHLTTLRLSDNHFDGKIPFSIGKLSLLTTLDLALNYFDGEIPSSMANLSHLTSLSFFRNKLVGKIPSFFGSLNQLTDLSFSSNTLSGNFPIALLNLTKLSFVDISSNQLTGRLPTNISSLSSLSYFDASVNSFFGTPPSALFTIPSLVYVELSENLFSGTLEFGNVSSSSKLHALYLGNNNFRGPFPRSISKLANLVILNISNYNVQQGPVDFSIFSPIKGLTQLYISHLNTTTTIDLNAVLSLHLKSIAILDLSGNHVSTTNKSSVANQRVQCLRELYLSDCGITEVPEIIRSQQCGSVYGRIGYLDISSNKIKGQVPAWLWKRVEGHVDLSNNTFTGFERPTKSALWKPSVTYLSASSNNFTGKIPSFICTLHSLDTLDLSNNNFNGPIPPCIGNLSRLILRRNRLSGSLPENIYGRNLISLDVGHNQLVGKLPRSLIHSPTLEVLNVENNMINDSFPFWLTSLTNLQILVLRSNAFHGSIQQTRFAKLRIMDISQNNFSGTLPSVFFASWTAMSMLEQDEEMYMGSGYYHDSMVLMNKGVAMELVRILKIYTAVDFSGNKLQGEIPNSIGLLRELRVLNLSSNAFSGRIPSSLADLKALESLDVSQNKLSGVIPQELASLSYLSHMNFSHNHLAGLVPGGTQFRTQGCSSFEDNDGLFGPSLDQVCRHTTNTSTPEGDETLETEEEHEEVLSWVAAAVGFAPGVIFGFTIGCMLISYRPDWFMNIFGRSKRRRASTTAR